MNLAEQIEHLSVYRHPPPPNELKKKQLLYKISFEFFLYMMKLTSVGEKT